MLGFSAQPTGYGLRTKNINVNCVLPTVLDTPENRAAGDGIALNQTLYI